MKTFVSISDIHYPFEDKVAVSLVTAFLKDFHPDTLILNGDMYDMPSISKYAMRRTELLKTPTIQSQLDYGNGEVSKLIDAASAKDNKFCLGNHEDRWELYLGTEAKALASLRCLEFDKVFNLDGIDWKKYGSGFWLNSRLFIHHGTRINVNYTENERQEAGASTITGHKHQQRVTYFQDRSRIYKNIGQGCLCELDVPYLRTPPNWTQGFVVGFIYDDEKFRAVEVEIVHGDEGVWMAPFGETKYSVAYGETRVRIKKYGILTERGN